MSIKSLLLMFSIIYTVLIIGLGLIISYFDLKGNSGINIGILIGCIIWVCTSFGKKNGRYFTRKEKTIVVIGIIIIDLILQAIFGAIALIQLGSDPDLITLFYSLGVIGVIHAIGIYFFVGLAKKPLVKQGVITG